MTSQFSVLLRQLRRQTELTQEDLAERSGLSVRTIRRLETGERANPQLDTVRLLADALRLEPDERARMLAAAGEHGQVVSPLVGETAFERQLAEAADDLAHAVGARVGREAELRRIQDPFPLPVRWQVAPDDVMDHWENICRVLPGESATPLDLAGRLPEIAEVYRRIPSGRLVVLGRAGSGKSVLAARFALDLLRTRERGGAVPVVFNVGSWNPTTTGFRDWLAAQLIRDHPGLATTGGHESNLATALVAAGRVLPVLDGFDELAAGLHRDAVDALNATPMPLLLTSRPGEYATVARTDPLTAAAAVRLIDLTVTDLVDYLPRTTRKNAGATAWDPVLDELRDHPDRPASVNVRAVLTTPLMVGLARAIYSDNAGRDPSVLLDTDRFGSQYALEDHLLGSFIPTVYRDQHPRWDPHRVQRWLGHLARHLDRLGTRDLAWWQLGRVMHRGRRAVVVGLVAGVAFAFVAGLTAALMGGLGFGTGAADGLTAGPLEGLAGGLAVGLLSMIGPAIGGAAFTPSRVRIRLHGGKRRLGARFVRRFMVALALGLGFAGVLGLAGLLGIQFWIVGRLGPGPWYGVLSGLVFGPLVGLAWGIMARIEAPVDLRTGVSPTDLLKTNRATVIFESSVLGLVCAVGYGVLAGLLHGPRYGLLHGLSYGVVLGLAIGWGVVLGLTAWGQWLVFARVWLPLTGRLPWSVAAFLDDACRRGVLRQVGAVYQFRHARLQDHLAREDRGGTGPNRTGSSTVTVTIYLSDEAGHQQVETAVEDFLALAGAHVDHREDPVLGSWSRRLRAKLAPKARSPLAREALLSAAHAADTRLVHVQDAAVTAELLQHLGPVITSLASTKEAVIRAGALLIVKIDDKVAVHQLTASQQLQLDHQRALATSPHDILTTLRLGFTSTTDRMSVQSFPGAYEDDHGVEPVAWRIEPSDRNGFEIHATVRGVPIWGPDLDSLEPDDRNAPGVERLALNTVGELDHCTIRGDLPCTIDVNGRRHQSAVHFALELRNTAPAPKAANLNLSVIVDGMTYAVTDEWFEDGLRRLEEALPDGVRLVCCVTCLYSDYFPGGHGLLGIACHRGAKAQYLAVRSKADYWSVPVTEEVPETYLCGDYERRIPGTGYRG